MKDNFNSGAISRYRNEIFGLAILSVIISHYTVEVARTLDSGKLYMVTQAFYKYVGSLGVEIFVFLSGMGLYFSTKKKGNISGFYERRLSRIMIPYLLLGAVFWAVIDFGFLHCNIYKYIYDLTMGSFWLKGNSTFWFVGLILLLYFIFPFVYEVVTSKHSMINCILLLSVIWIALFSYNQIPDTAFPFFEIALMRIPMFILGVWFGESIYQKKAFSTSMLVIAGIGIVIKLFYATGKMLELDGRNLPHYISSSVNTVEDYYRFIDPWSAIGYLIVLVYILYHLKIRWISKVLCFLGGITFELYLTHQIFRSIFVRLELPTWKPWCYSLAMLLALVLAVMVQQCTKRIESRMRDGKKLDPS